MNKPLVIILITVLFDIIWLWLVLPILPFIVESYWYWEFYVWVTFSIFSLWMFFWGLFFWKLSDKIWRNTTLKITIFLNIIWYLLFAFSSNLLIFLIARFIGWLAASWFAVWQAYIADISTDENRTKNMAMIWAMFWVWFMIWPVFWGFLSSMQDKLNYIWYIAAFIVFLNFLLVKFFLPKVKIKKIWVKEDNNFKITNPLIILLFFISFVVALWFSRMQCTLPLVMNDRFSLDAEHVWYLFWFIWLVAIIYQAKLIKYVRNYFNEPQMLIFGLCFLIVWFLLFSINIYFFVIFISIMMFPIGYWTINPTIASMHSKLWANHIWKILWINASIISLWNIIWPFIAGLLYIFWSWLPYIFSVFLFLIALALVIFKVRKY